MSGARYRVSVNGFTCHRQTLDTMFQSDGKGDEVMIVVGKRELDASGSPVTAPLADLSSESKLMGDTNTFPNRVQAGSAPGGRGGLITGDQFPSALPWKRFGDLNASRVPPYPIWEGDLEPGQRIVLLTPTIWEWDDGRDMFNWFIDWLKSVDDEFGARAKELFGGIWPVSKPVFDAVSLGIQTVGTLSGLWSFPGLDQSRPIGTQRDPANRSGFTFNPMILALNSETAEFLISDNPLGMGNGIVALRYVDDPFLEGSYSIYIQVEKVSDAAVSNLQTQSGWRYCSACQGLYFGPGQASSRCPEGGEHAGSSGDYSLPMDVSPASDRQSGWRWCDKCQGLFFGPAHASSSCPAGGPHNPPQLSGSSDYSPYHNASEDSQRQSDWRWCSRCQCMFWGGGQPDSTCPAGGAHVAAEESLSGNYSLPHVP